MHVNCGLERNELAGMWRRQRVFTWRGKWDGEWDGCIIEDNEWEKSRRCLKKKKFGSGPSHLFAWWIQTADLMYSKTQKKKKSNHTTLLVISSWSRIPLRNSLEIGCHLPGAMCMEVWGAGVGGGGKGLVVAGTGWGGEHRGRWGGGGAGPWSVQAGGKMNNSPHVRASPCTEWREVWVRL